MTGTKLNTKVRIVNTCGNQGLLLVAASRRLQGQEGSGHSPGFGEGSQACITGTLNGNPGAEIFPQGGISHSILVV